MRHKHRAGIEWTTGALATSFATTSHVTVTARTVENPDGGEVRTMPELLRRAIANGARACGDGGDLAKEYPEDSRGAETP